MNSSVKMYTFKQCIQMYKNMYVQRSFIHLKCTFLKLCIMKNKRVLEMLTFNFLRECIMIHTFIELYSYF